ARSPVETSFAWPCQQRQRLSEMAGPNEISSALDRPSSFAVTSSTSIAYESHPLAPCRSRRRLNLPFQLVRSIPVYTCEMADPAISLALTPPANCDRDHKTLVAIALRSRSRKNRLLHRNLPCDHANPAAHWVPW